jgi:MFS family permease
MMLSVSKIPSMNPGESGMANGSQQMAGSAFSKQQVFMAISAIFVGYFINSYFTQSLGGAAAPKIAGSFENGVKLISWSVSIPSLGLAIATLLGGKLSDIYGRRALLMAAMTFILLGTILCSFSPTIAFFIASRTIQSLGFGIIAPLCYTVIGDIFMGAAHRGKWIGLLNLPMGFALVGIILGPLFIDTIKIWQLIFWCALPLIVVCIIFIFRMPALIQGTAGRIDVPGAILVTIASSAIIIGLSIAGTPSYPWGSWQVISLLGAAIIFGALFLLAESKAKEPFLYIELLKNRVFMTISIAGFLSFFGLMSIMLYFQIFLQAIQDRSTMASAWIGQIPVSVLMAFIGVPTGFLLARTKHYKSLLVTGYAMATVAMIAMNFLNNRTIVFVEVSIALLTGLGLGVIPTINTLLLQSAVPRKLMGAAMAVLFFSISIGSAVAVAIQGSAINVQYTNNLQASLPEAVTKATNEKTVHLLNDLRVLLSKEDLSGLKTINEIKKNMDLLSDSHVPLLNMDRIDLKPINEINNIMDLLGDSRVLLSKEDLSDLEAINEVKKALSDYRALLNVKSSNDLQKSINAISDSGPVLFEQTKKAISSSAEAGLKIIFLMAAITMALAFLLILTIPVISMDRPAEENQATKPAAA